MMSTKQQERQYLRGTSTPLAEAFDAGLFDLDGVVYRGPVALQHAPESIASARARGMRAVFVTNNANREPATVADQLTSLDVPAEPADVVTSSQAAAALLARELPKAARVLAVGGPGLITALRDVGLTVVSSADDGPLAVVQGFAPSVGWVQLTEAAYAIGAGARYVATNLDTTIPTDRGIAPGNGSLVAVVRTATGVDPVSAGKPEPEIFLQAAQRAGAARPLMIGDRLDTDLAGAIKAGQLGLLVLTGVSDGRAAVLAQADERPAFISPDLRGLLVAHPAPREDGSGEWSCGLAGARVWPDASRAEVREADGTVTGINALDDPRVVVDLSLDALRALCCAAWASADDGAPLGAFPRLRVSEDRGARGSVRLGAGGGLR